MTTFLQYTKRVKTLKRDVMALYLAYKRPDVPWYAKMLAIMVVGYALSPIDLIPDFVPVLGYLDDLLLLPLGIWLVIHLVPDHIIEECRVQAAEFFRDSKPKIWAAGVVIVLIWIFVVSLIIYKIVDALE